MKWQAMALKILPRVIDAYPKSRFIFLTLTVRNCELAELRNTLNWMQKAWKKFTKRKEFASVQGWLRSVEVTRSVDDTCHPHYHVLLMVPGSYFGHAYVSQGKWTDAWADCLEVMYTPIVDVRVVRPGKLDKGSEAQTMISAICETFKYVVKPSDILRANPESKLTPEQWLTGLTSQLYKTRKIATGGVLKQYLKELENEPEDLIHINEDDYDFMFEPPRVGFVWDGDSKHYVASDLEALEV
jgi:hypothetical protein